MKNRNDELNVISEQITKQKVIDYYEYFGGEELTQEQRNKRIALAFRIESVMLFAFSLISLMVENENYDFVYAVKEITNRFKEEITSYSRIDDYMKIYSENRINQIVQSTIDNLNTAYFTSKERASVIAANESDTVLNRDDYIKALKSGKTKKKWIDIKDSRERPTHREVGGTVIEIDQLFNVGSSVMRFPHDVEYCSDANELVNCRCSIKYL